MTFKQFIEGLEFFIAELATKLILFTFPFVSVFVLIQGIAYYEDHLPRKPATHSRGVR